MKKDNQGNWNFEYDTPESDDSGPEDTIQNSSSNTERPTISAAAQQKAGSTTLNLVSFIDNSITFFLGFTSSKQFA